MRVKLLSSSFPNRLGAILLGIVLAALPFLAMAQKYPDKPIKIMLGFTPGGTIDSVLRVFKTQLEKELGQPIIVDYRPGAAGIVAAEQTARAAPDGYTLLIIDSGPLTVAPALKKQNYEPGSSFSPVGLVAMGAAGAIIVPADSPLRNLTDLIDKGRASPGQLAYGTSGIGGLLHLSAELFQVETGTSLTHVPYKGGAQLMTDVMGGQLPVAFASITTVIAQANSGKIRILGLVAPQKVSSLPGVSTLAELGVPVSSGAWIALVGPANLPPPVVAVLSGALQKVLADPVVVDGMRKTGFDANYEAPAKVHQMTVDELDRWTRLVKAKRIETE